MTIDAMGCQKAIAATITDRGAAYVLQVKKNQPTLHDLVEETFDELTRRLALNLLRQDKSTKVGVKAKRLKACLEEDYLLKLLGQEI